MKLASVSALLHDQLKDLFSAESQLLKALPKMAKQASADPLRKAFSAHLKETRGQVKRLQQVGRMLGMKLPGKKCKGMEGLLAEGKEVLQSEGTDGVLDLGLIAGAQRVEHYEISAYTSACKLASQLGHDDAVSLLQETLDEEIATDQKLASIAAEVMPSAETE